MFIEVHRGLDEDISFNTLQMRRMVFICLLVLVVFSEPSAASNDSMLANDTSIQGNAGLGNGIHDAELGNFRCRILLVGLLLFGPVISMLCYQCMFSGSATVHPVEPQIFWASVIPAPAQNKAAPAAFQQSVECCAAKGVDAEAPGTGKHKNLQCSMQHVHKYQASEPTPTPVFTTGDDGRADLEAGRRHPCLESNAS